MAAVCGCQPSLKPDTNPKEDDEPATVSLNEVSTMTPTFIGSVSCDTLGDVKEGSTVKLKLYPGEVLMSGFGEVHMEHIHVHVADTVYFPTFPEGAGEYVQELEMEVKAPSKDFNITVAYAVQQKFKDNGFTLSLEPGEPGIELYGVSPDKKYSYFDCYVLTPDAYTITDLEFKIGGGQWKDLNSVSGCGWSRTESIDRVYSVRVRPNFQDVNDNVTIRVKGSQHHRYKISWTNTEYIDTDLPEGYQPNMLPSEAIDGEKVYGSFYTKDGYYLAGAKADVEGIDLECMYRAYVFFTMPASDVNITLDFQKMIPVSYSKSEHISSAEIYDANDIYYGVPVSVAIPGESVFLFANGESGYKPTKAFNDKGESFDFVSYGDGLDRYAYYAEVRIPAGASSAVISAEAAKGYWVSGEAGVIYCDGGSLFIPGERVSFQVAVPSGKSIESVSVRCEDGTPVDCQLDNTVGTFIMPSANVVVTASFKDVESGTIAHISAIYDDYEYSVYSQTSPYYQVITAEGFDVPVGTTLYISITDDYGEPFWVGVKMGDSVSYYQASIDPDMGDASFGKSFSFVADTIIKVGSSKDSVKF